MNSKFTVWPVALLSAVLLHILVLNLPSPKKPYDLAFVASDIELTLLPQTSQEWQPSINTQNQASLDTQDQESIDTRNRPPITQNLSNNLQIEDDLDTKSTWLLENDLAPSNDLSVNDPDQFVHNSTKTQSIDIEEEASEQDPSLDKFFLTSTDKAKNTMNTESSQVDVTSRSSLLDLSQINLTNQQTFETDKVFSSELRQQIADAQKAQQEYINSLPAEKEDYAITRDSDGTRYVNIKGVCWRLPKEGSDEGWAIVFDGCGIKSRLFHLELNISPRLLMNEILGPDSPINQHFQTD